MPGWAPLTIALIEVYRFLSSEVKAYLPSYETVTVWHLRDLAMGVKKIIRCDDVKVIDVPQFEGLAIKDIFGYACNTPDVEHALPPLEGDRQALPRLPGQRRLHADGRPLPAVGQPAGGPEEPEDRRRGQQHDLHGPADRPDLPAVHRHLR